MDDLTETHHPCSIFQRSPRSITLVADVFRALVHRVERSAVLSAPESDNRFAQSFDELAVVLKKRVTFVADHEGADGIDSAWSSSLRKAVIRDRFCAFHDVAVESEDKISVQRDGNQTGFLQICGRLDDRADRNETFFVR
jgi:hypothetical protein